MTGRSIITYSIDAVLGAFPVEAILEIYRVVGFIPFENAPDRIVGYSSFRGQPLYGIDVQDIFNVSGHVYDADSSIIVTKSGETLLGILVDRIGDIRRIDDTFEIPREHFELEVKSRFIRQAYSINDVPHYELNLEQLFTEEEHNKLEQYSSRIEDTLTRLYT